MWRYAAVIIALMSDVTEEIQPHPEPESPPQKSSAPLRWLAPAALVVALIAVGLAAWALVSASSTASASSSAGTKQSGDPKMRVCTAFNTVTQAVMLQTHANLGQDPVAQGAVAGNARLALLGGGQYLLSRLDSGTPSDLADAVRSFGNDLEDIGINALAGVPNSDPTQAARLSQGEMTRKQIVDLCK